MNIFSYLENCCHDDGGTADSSAGADHQFAITSHWSGCFSIERRLNINWTGLPLYLNVLLLNKEVVLQSDLHDQFGAGIFGQCASNIASKLLTQEKVTSRIAEVVKRRIAKQLVEQGIVAEMHTGVEYDAFLAIGLDIQCLDTDIFFREITPAFKGMVGVLPAAKITKTLSRHLEKEMPVRIRRSMDRDMGLKVVVYVVREEDEQPWLHKMISQLKSCKVLQLQGPDVRLRVAVETGTDVVPEVALRGLLRPWVVLSSMLPEQREFIASTLSLNLDRNQMDPASESRDILVGRNGITDRIHGHAQDLVSVLGVDRRISWVEILVRTIEMCSMLMPSDFTGLDWLARSRDARDRSNEASVDNAGLLTEVGRLELLVLRMVQARKLEVASDAQRSFLVRADLETSINMHALRCLAMDTLAPLALLEQAFPNEILGVFRLLGPDISHGVDAVISILLQRLFLVQQSFDIEALIPHLHQFTPSSTPYLSAFMPC